MTITAEAEASPTTTNRSAPLLGLAYDVGLPLVGYYGMHLLGASDWSALLVGAGAAGLRLIWVAARTRRTTWFSALMFVVFGVGLVLALLGGDPRLILLKDSLTTGAVGLVFLASLLGARPMTFSAYRTWQPEGAAELEALWDVEPGVRHVFRVGSVVWGVGLLAEAALRVPVILALPVDVAVGASTGLQVVVLTGLGVWNAVYAVRAQRRLTA